MIKRQAVSIIADPRVVICVPSTATSRVRAIATSIADAEAIDSTVLNPFLARALARAGDTPSISTKSNNSSGTPK